MKAQMTMCLVLLGWAMIGCNMTESPKTDQLEEAAQLAKKITAEIPANQEPSAQEAEQKPSAQAEQEPSAENKEPSAENKEPSAENKEPSAQAEQKPSAQAEQEPASEQVAAEETSAGLNAQAESQTAINASDALEAEELATSEGLHLAKITLAKGVKKRQPVEAGTSFPLENGGRIYAILDVKNPEKIENEVRVTWVPEGSSRERGGVSVSVGPQVKWRTWAYTRSARKVGKWIVVVRDKEGKILGRAPFEITPAVETPTSGES